MTTFTAKAFIDDKPVEQVAATINEARELFQQYRSKAGCDAAYIYEGDRIIESWSDSYDAYLVSTEATIGECPECGGPMNDDEDYCHECGYGY